MKNFTDLLTPEQKTALGNCFIINDDNELIEIISNAKVTIDHFNIVIVYHDRLEIATAEDISFYNPEIDDFDFSVGRTFFYRNHTPHDVLTMLDEYLGKEKYDKNDDDNE